MTAPNSDSIVYCRCAYSDRVPAEVKDAVLAALAASDRPFEAVADLCELAAGRDPALASWARGGGPRIVACRPRAVKWLFHAGGAELADENTRVLDMKARPAEEIVGALPASSQTPADCGAPADGTLKVVLYEGPGSRAMAPSRRRELLVELLDAGYRVARTGSAGAFAWDTAAAVVVGDFDGEATPAGLRDDARVVCLDVTGKCACGAHQAIDAARESLGLPAPGGWVPWFPVLDYDRCIGCKQCANFCLFGVFEVDDEGKPLVADPPKCKTDCPACARMCPQVAIIFPKYPGAPIDGSEVNEADVRAERAGTDLKKALRGDVYNVLRRRSGRGKLPAHPTPADLAKAAEELQIPAGVLKSLNVTGSEAAGADGCACQDEAPCCGGESGGGGETERDVRE